MALVITHTDIEFKINQYQPHKHKLIQLTLAPHSLKIAYIWRSYLIMLPNTKFYRINIIKVCRQRLYFTKNQQQQQQMCGRMFQTLPLARLLQIARTNKCLNQQFYTSSYNVCPTTYIPVIKTSRFYSEDNIEQIKDEDLQQHKQLAYMKWGHHSKFNTVINGRVQELLNKRMFVNFIKNRCVVIMEGYYQWNTKKQPFSLRPKDGDHFLVAGLYTDDNQIIILTKDATPDLSNIHERMPVILSHEEVNLWINPKNTKDIQAIINKSLLKKDKQVWKNVGFAKVAPYVSQKNQKSVKCLMTVEEYKKELDKNGLMKYWKKPPAVEAVSLNGQVIKSSTKTDKIQLNKHDLEDTISLPTKKQIISDIKSTQIDEKKQLKDPNNQSEQKPPKQRVQ